VYYPILCKQIYLWYRDYLSADVDKKGLEITEVIRRFTEEKNISRIPNEKDGFFNYLTASINREKTNFNLKYSENDTFKIPRETIRKLREVEDVIRMNESQLGREITTNEQIQVISEWFKITEKKATEYLKLINNKNDSGFYFINENGVEENILDSENLKPPYLPDSGEEPENALLINFNMANIIEAVTSVLAEKQERSRDCYRALFTLYCIENCKDFEGLYPVLDSQILETWQKEDKKPTQYGIYLTYHPDAQQASAEAIASKNIKEFLNDIETRLKEKI